MVSVEQTALHWQWAFDAASRALAADHDLLPPATLHEETDHLAHERKELAALLAPWLPTGPVTPRMLGVPAETESCLFELDGMLTDSDRVHAAAWGEALEPVLAGFGRAPFGDGDYRAYFAGRPRLAGLEVFLEGRGLHLPRAAVDDVARRKGALVEHSLRVRGVAARPGARSYLHLAGLARLRRVVVSDSVSTQRMLELAGLADLVDRTMSRAEAERLPRAAPFVPAKLPG